ncbi:TonB-dependent receptor [Pseudoteredinibacter isoporae]|uniref:Outer membrane receptor protein involved in Fe transport n=1 Tax=Pseudoteredinibacter isoporae TaxID=570281 RepID=A0A7X0JPV5_9GAMM|nr:TonB-dependent receptor [Pseudoteredinibacter isoporae]MBB6520055.1 outer membrane receptor protein involved in Fe transport [Pseudoteredinibacter isoporae]NHO85627.1 TonB-dependent receptor [Pseudoteredinibacter isoporae]NIB25921.1 TonB-dependent receptor [Pseudoteredinibacter isoporae]
MKAKFLPLAIQAAIACASTTAMAQESALEEVVVTGTANGSEVRKLDAAFAITNVNDEDIAKLSPKSTADLLKSIPGVWAESSGGVAGANVFVRGFPAGGDAPFYTLQLEGAPIFPPSTLSFLENTTLFRVDETIERVEGLRGGPQPVQDNGQPGLTTNFILKRGHDESEGLVKYTTSDYDLQRFDAVASGKITDGLYYMVGGYVKSSPGVRDAGFSAEKGRQFTVNITKELENGSLSGYHRVTDDHGTWYLPGALNVPGVDASYTQVGTLNRQARILAGPNGDVRNVDLGDGRGWDGSVSGLNADFDINENWSLSNNLNFTQGDADTLGFVPNGGAVNVGQLLADPSLDASAVVVGDITGAVTGNAISADRYLQQFGVWEVRKNIESFTNNLSLTGSYDSVDFVLGYYTATTSVDEFWSLGNQKYYVVGQGGERVNGIACNAADVDSCGWNYDIDATGDMTQNAVYATVTYRFNDELSVDFGVRNEEHDVDYSVDEGLTGNISKFVNYNENKTSFTVGANYALTEDQGLFARVSKGFKLPYFDDFRDNYGAFQGGEDLIKEVKQFELGYKASFETVSAYLTFFGNEVVGDTFVAQPGAPAQVFTNEAYGLEVDVKWVHESGFSLLANATIQETEITESPDNNGNEAQRQPPYQIRLSPSYDIELNDGMSATLYGTLTAVDDRFSDNGNTVVLPGYEKVDLGVIFYPNEQLSLQLLVDNVTDEEGLTEGDPRNPSAPNGRYILPRTTKFSISYAF